MRIITIRGLTGSGADEIGRLLAKKLGYDFVDREIIALIAKRLKLPKQEVSMKEMPPSTLFGRITEVMAGTYSINPGSPDVSLPTWLIPLNDVRYRKTLEHVIKEIARNRSIVIVGRGSQFILKNDPDVFHIFTVAPIEIRISRMSKELKSDEKTAKQEIDRLDGSRRAFIRRYFKAELDDPKYYDIVINTGHFTLDAAVSLIAYALKVRE
jgi:cytidylate kinase